MKISRPRLPPVGFANVNITKPTTINEGQLATFTATTTDPGSKDTYEVKSFSALAKINMLGTAYSRSFKLILVRSPK